VGSRALQTTAPRVVVSHVTIIHHSVHHIPSSVSPSGEHLRQGLSHTDDAVVGPQGCFYT